MRLLRNMLPVALITSLLLGVSSQAVLAGPLTMSEPDRYSVHCQAEGCIVEMDFEDVPDLARLATGVAVNVLQSRGDLLPAGTQVDLSDDLILTLPSGELQLPNADLVLEMGPKNRIERLHGTAEIAFPTLGIFDDVDVLKPVVADVGLEPGDNLDYLNLPLDSERQYLFFRFGTGLDVQAKLESADGRRRNLNIALPAGQNAALVVDTEEPLVYLAGNLTLSQSGPLALAGDLFDGSGSLDSSPDALLGRTSLHASGLYSDDLQQVYVRVGAGHTVDAGIVGQALNVEATPVSIQGSLTVSAEGLLVNGVLRSSIEPDVVFEGDLKVEAFLPFASDLERAYVRVDGRAAVPVVKSHADVVARWQPGEDLRVDGALVTPLNADRGLMVREQSAQHASERSEALAQNQERVVPLGAEIRGRASDGAVLIRDVTERAWAWAAGGASDGIEIVQEGLTALAN